jgi:uncharacterized membrane protein YfcA
MLACLVALTAGIVKGMVGFAMPLVLISGLSTFLDPRIALAGLLIPTLATNSIQTFRAGLGPALDAARQHWRYLLMVIVAIFATAQFAATLPRQTFSLILGVPVVTLSIIQLAGWRPKVSPEWRTKMEWVIGTVSGVLGGLAGTWGPTTVLYLLAIETPKARQMVVQGVIYGLGSVVLVLSHLKSGILNVQTAQFSTLLLPGALLGLWIGFKLQDKLDAERFRRVTLILLVVAGLNLIRRGLFG